MTEGDPEPPAQCDQCGRRFTGLVRVSLIGVDAADILRRQVMTRRTLERRVTRLAERREPAIAPPFVAFARAVIQFGGARRRPRQRETNWRAGTPGAIECGCSARNQWWSLRSRPARAKVQVGSSHRSGGSHLVATDPASDAPCNPHTPGTAAWVTECKQRLSDPFPVDLIEEKNGLAYLSHEVIRQRLIAATGNCFDWTINQILFRDDGVTRRTVDPKTKQAPAAALYGRGWPARHPRAGHPRRDWDSSSGCRGGGGGCLQECRK